MEKYYLILLILFSACVPSPEEGDSDGQDSYKDRYVRPSEINYATDPIDNYIDYYSDQKTDYVIDRPSIETEVIKKIYES